MKEDEDGGGDGGHVDAAPWRDHQHAHVSPLLCELNFTVLFWKSVQSQIVTQC